MKFFFNYYYYFSLDVCEDGGEPHSHWVRMKFYFSQKWCATGKLLVLRTSPQNPLQMSFLFELIPNRKQLKHRRTKQTLLKAPSSEWEATSRTCTSPVPCRRSGRRSAALRPLPARPGGCAGTPGALACRPSSPRWWRPEGTFCYQNCSRWTCWRTGPRSWTSPTAVSAPASPGTRCARRAARFGAHRGRRSGARSTQVWAGSHSIRWGSKTSRWREWSWWGGRAAWTAPSGVQSVPQLSIYSIPWVRSGRTRRREHGTSGDFMPLTAGVTQGAAEETLSSCCSPAAGWRRAAWHPTSSPSVWGNLSLSSSTARVYTALLCAPSWAAVISTPCSSRARPHPPPPSSLPEIMIRVLMLTNREQLSSNRERESFLWKQRNWVQSLSNKSKSSTPTAKS